MSLVLIKSEKPRVVTLIQINGRPLWVKSRNAQYDDGTSALLSEEAAKSPGYL
jgi:hypothetical protein